MNIHFLLISSTASGGGGSRLIKPHTSIDQSEITLAENGTIEITCSGKYKIVWVYPRSVISRVIVDGHHCKGCRARERHTSTLRVHRAEFTDTGQYHCLFRPHSERVNNQTASSVYVYVKSNGKFLVWNLKKETL